MGRWADNKRAKKHNLDSDYGYGPLDQLVFVGETTYQGGPEYYFKNGWSAFNDAPIVNPAQGNVSNLRSTSNNPLTSIAYSWYKSNSTAGKGFLYLVWCRRGFEYSPFIEAVGGKGAANDEVVMTSISGHHILAAREITKDPSDDSGGVVLGEVTTNPKSKLNKNDPARFHQAVEELRDMKARVTGLLDIAVTL